MTVADTAALMCVPDSYVYGAAKLLGLKFRNDSIGNRNGAGRPKGEAALEGGAS